MLCFLSILMTVLISMLNNSASSGHRSECNYPKDDSKVDDNSRSKTVNAGFFPSPKYPPVMLEMLAPLD